MRFVGPEDQKNNQNDGFFITEDIREDHFP